MPPRLAAQEPEARLREHALRIFHSALRAADPHSAILKALAVAGETLTAGDAQFDLRRFRRIFVTGAGKASANMAAAVERVLGDRITDGLINTKHGHLAELQRIRLNECGHPIPDESGVAGAREIASLAENAGEDDLLLVLTSGGASALLPLPAGAVSLSDKQAATSLLLGSGANIHEINAVRKHLSLVKGGQLSQRAWPATVLALILSDVVGDDLDVIGSGITVPDTSTFADAVAILKRYKILEKVPQAVRIHLERGENETPKPGDEKLTRTTNVLIGSNRIALEAASAEAAGLGYSPMILSSTVEGEARVVAQVLAAIVRETATSAQPVRPPACILAGGETTVTLGGDGKGGRNQELALAAALHLAGRRGIAFLSAGTDGSDGPTDAAGAVCDGSTVALGAAMGLDARAYLANNDSWTFFDRTGGLIRTGPTGTNVADIQIALVS